MIGAIALLVENTLNEIVLKTWRWFDLDFDVMALACLRFNIM